MNKNRIKEVLDNYQALVRQIDHRIIWIENTFRDQISCKKGCDSCCRSLTLFPVEALAMARAFSGLSREIRTWITCKPEPEKGSCPLLMDRQCVLYSARPVICRTHGYPLYMEKDGQVLVDFCPENFKGITSFPKETLINIEQLNTTLAVINRHFIESVKTEVSFPDRVQISEALCLAAIID